MYSFVILFNTNGPRELRIVIFFRYFDSHSIVLFGHKHNKKLVPPLTSYKWCK